jgi:flagellar assembly protein FliH
VIKAEHVRWECAEADVTPAAWRPGSLVAADVGQSYNPDEVKQALLASAISQSQQAVQAAREQAAELLRAAREQAAEVARQARDGGLRSAEAETAQALLAAHGVLDEVQAWRAAALARSQEAVLGLVVAVARRIFGDGLVLEPEVLEAAFGRALAEARPLGQLRVHLHPADAALLGPHWAAAAQASSGQRLEMVPDASLRRGGCLIEGEYGHVDARVDSQLQVVLDAFEGVVRAEAGV